MKLLDRWLARFPSLTNSNLDSTNYAVRTKIQLANRARFLAKKILIQVALTPLYLLFVLPLAFLGAGCWIWRLDDEQRQRLRAYCERFWYYPSLCIHKSIEGRWFRTMEVVGPTCDIGCEDGIVTSLHFPGHVFDLGIEYIAANIPEGKVHRSVRVAGLPELPPDLDGAFQTIALVHVIDHIPPLAASLHALHRLARPGGRVCLLGLAHGYPQNLRRASGGILQEDWLHTRKGLYHFLTPEEWRAQFVAAGFDVIRLETFLGGTRGGLWTVLHSLFEINGSNDLWYAVDRLGVLPPFVRRHFCVPAALAISSWFITDQSSARSPCHFFAELRAASGPCAASPTQNFSSPT